MENRDSFGQKIRSKVQATTAAAMMPTARRLIETLVTPAFQSDQLSIPTK
jgi:hypothetical protein